MAEDRYTVRVAGEGRIVAAWPLDTFGAAMRHALTLGPDVIITIERRSPTMPGLWIMEARYLPTGPGRGWDFGMMTAGVDR